ncbi:uncharacterized LOC118071461 [Chelonus insularis]|uniref:uncharacterized LOC118071461 n=1 Tax=Chelonus insularis TaxID=460826 RepID=UPI00158D1A4F|nr:uncharacterized LOC118071461 [Chelonus insularis]KAG8148326.1 CinsV12_orph1 protein [Chelonus insularis]
MQELPGQREGTKKYFHNGYFYHLDPRSADIGNAFICSYRYRQWQCPVTAQKNYDGDINVKGEHGHTPTPFQEYQRFEEFKNKLKEQARKSTDPPNTIVQKLKIEYSDVAHLILQNSAKVHIIRERNKFRPKLPERLSDLGSLLVGYEPAQAIYQGQVTICETSSAVIFASNAMLERLNDCSEIYVDGTFKCVPRAIGAKQLLILHMRKMDVGIASVFVLCSGQTAELYTGIWNFLLGRAPRLRENLKTVMMDFERALIKSVKETMPWVTIRGCWFHFTRAISFHWQDLGLKNVSSPLVQDILSLAWVLPLLPKEGFPEAIEFYRKKANQVDPEYQDNVNKFINYLENQWLRIAEVVSVWRSPKRTNNICESFHRWLPQRLGVHPNLYAFIEKLATIITEIEGNWQDLERDGNAFGKKCRKKSAIDSYINYHQIMLFNRKIDVGEFLMKMKTQSVKNFITFKLYSPHSVKNLNPADICDPEELVNLLEYSQTIKCMDSSNIQTIQIIMEKEEKFENSVEESEGIPIPMIELEKQIYKRSPIVRRKKPVCLCCTSEAPSKITPEEIKEKKKLHRKLIKKHQPRYKLPPSVKKALKKAEKKKPRNQRITEDEPRYKLSPSFRTFLKKINRVTKH